MVDIYKHREAKKNKGDVHSSPIIRPAQKSSCALCQNTKNNLIVLSKCNSAILV